MNVKRSGFLIYVKAIINLLLHNLHDCTFKFGSHHTFTLKKQSSDEKGK